MPSFSAKVAGVALTAAAAVSAHGHTYGINVAGVWYDGYDPTTEPYESDPPIRVGWTAGDTDNGYIAPDAYATGDIICHKNATNAGGYASVQAGDNIEVYWSAWPSSHHGPVIDMLAKCSNGDCTTVDKTELEFFKIAGVGLVSDDTVPGTWGSDQLISNNNSWVIQIPSELESGNYVWRHEIIALHGAEESDGAQNYPQCFNLAVTGTGTLAPTGTLGEALYSESDAGILVNIYETLTTYDVPGPTQIASGTNLAQSELSITGSSAAITTGVSDSGSGAAAATTTAAAAVTTAASSSSVAATSAAAAAATSSTSAAEVATSSSTDVAAAATATASSGKTCNKKRRHARDIKN